jgi:HSP20 family protein
MKDDPQDIFRQMDLMMAQMFAEMTHGIANSMPPHAVGYRIILRGDMVPQEPPHGSATQPRDPDGPVPEVHLIGDEVKVVAELPGAEKESIRLNIKDAIITIEADGRGQHYTTHADLPPVDATSMKTSYKNGVLEVTFAVMNDDQGQKA